MRVMLLLFFSLHLINPDYSTYRKLLAKSLDDKTAAKQFYEQLKGAKEDRDPIVLGFRAMSELMLCKHLLNPISKIGHFNKGRDLLESAIHREPGNPELLFFRLTTQINVPSILNYKSNIENDKQQLIKYLKKGAGADAALYHQIKDYLVVSNCCTAAEKASIKLL